MLGVESVWEIEGSPGICCHVSCAMRTGPLVHLSSDSLDVENSRIAGSGV